MVLQIVLLIFAVISLPMQAYAADSAAEAYWKANLGNDISMPKVVKDSLLGLSGTGSKEKTMTSRANQENSANGAQEYAQQLSKIKTNGNRNWKADAAQEYAQKLSKIKTNGNRNWKADAAQEYAQELSKIKTNGNRNWKADAAQEYAQELSKIKTNGNRNWKADAAQEYAQQLSKIKTNGNRNWKADAAQEYAQQLSKIKTNGNRNWKADAAQEYAQQLSKIKTNGNRNWKADAAQEYAQELSKIKTNGNRNWKADAAQEYAQELSKIKTNGNRNWKAHAAQEYGQQPSYVSYFFEKALTHPGTRMKLHFTLGAQEARFLPSEVANSTPFSSSKLPEILKSFAVEPGTDNAKVIEKTIAECESKEMKGEERSCETSLEAMVDYAKSRLGGGKVKALSTEVTEETEQEYKVEKASKIKNEVNLVCHKMVYPYAVFYCHALSKTDAYDVSLVDASGKKVRGIAVCHKDTSPWNPGHLAFQLLKVKPGTVPICHFLNLDAMIWVPNS